MKDNDSKWKWLTLATLVLLIVVGLSYFLFTKDSHEGAITGWQAFQQMDASFWGWAIGLTALAGASFFLFAKIYDKVKDLGATRWMLIVGLIFLSIAWGKGCDVKSNDGVTSPKGRPTPTQIDTTRVAAEDLLPK